MKLPSLTSARLVRRRKRFLAEAQLPDESISTVYCPNTGRMLGCSHPGSQIFLSEHDTAKRKHRYTWELTRTSASLVGVNTSRSNFIVREGIEQGKILKKRRYASTMAEVKINSRTRLDLRLDRPSGPPCFAEIKNCTLVHPSGAASFPDAVSSRGTKHLQELIELRGAGYPAMVLFLVQRMDANHFVPAWDIDAKYSSWLVEAWERGVEILCYDVHITLQHIEINSSIPVKLQRC